MPWNETDETNHRPTGGAAAGLHVFERCACRRLAAVVGLLVLLLLNLLFTRTVSLTEFASRTLPVKVHLKKNPEAEKLDGKA